MALWLVNLDERSGLRGQNVRRDKEGVPLAVRQFSNTIADSAVLLCYYFLTFLQADFDWQIRQAHQLIDYLNWGWG